jgi:hypothetical protein
MQLPFSDSQVISNGGLDFRPAMPQAPVTMSLLLLRLPRRLVVVVAIAGCVGFASSAFGAAKVDFNRDVRPVLSDNCFACHGPDTQKMKGGLRLDLRDVAIKPAKSGKVAIMPGRPDDSELVRRLFTEDADDLMPPAESHKTLTASQKDLLKRWIAEGAEYQGHWAYTPPAKATVSDPKRAVDELVQRRLLEKGLKPSPAADRRTLIRRLYFDLVGLPPKPDEVDAFERDKSPEAYERLVERLLASEHFGERMAIGWLDVVRFADTIGYHSDNPRNIWPYRDYVIRAFNANKPFDQFTREQLAGDLLPNPTLEQKVASGFNRLLLTTEEGGAQAKDYEARYLTDRVRAVGSVWLGQTIGCAQCHDHKFDPIAQRDFYAMGAFFADVKEAIIGGREPGMFVPTPVQGEGLDWHAWMVDLRQRQFDGPHPELADSYARWLDGQEKAYAAEARWTRQRPARADSAEGAKLKVRDDQSVLASGKRPDKDTYTLRFTNALAGVVGLRLEALPDDALPQKGPGRFENGNFVLTEVVAHVEREGSEPRKVQLQSARATHEQTTLADNNPYKAWNAASVIDGDVKGDSAGWAVLPHVGQAQQLLLELKEPLSLAAGETLVVELQQRHGNGGHMLGAFRLATATDAEAIRSPFIPPPAKEIADVLKVPADHRDPVQGDKLFNYFKSIAPELADLRAQLAEAKKSRADFEATVPRSLITERNDTPRMVRLLPRGNWMIETGDVMEPALPAFLVKDKPTDRRLTRLDLANWLVAPENPLTARVVINRLWKQFFGVGLSKVMDDLGAQGETPPNQPLLDWLACEFRDSGWDMKHMVRLLVLSDTYRQTSRVSREELARDPDNRDLARQGRWRLDAELVRDNALAIAGLLELKVGGPSVKPYQPDGYWENLNFPQRAYDESWGADQFRRGLYTWWQRSFVHPSMLAFDAPTREECAAERSRSNIPQQALVLLNDPTYVEAARSLALRTTREAKGDAEARIQWMWRQALGRKPQASEVATLRMLLEKHLGEYRANPASAEEYLKVGSTKLPADADTAELAAWTNVARTILNLHETITRG